MKKNNWISMISFIILACPDIVIAAGQKNPAQAILYGVGKCIQMASAIPFALAMYDFGLQCTHKNDDSEKKNLMIKMLFYALIMMSILPALEAGGFA